MWQSPGFSGTSAGLSIQMPLYNSNISIYEVSVLLVDNDKDSLLFTASMLQSFSYKVTPVELASTAFFLLSQGNKDFNLLLADINPADVDGLRLFQQAIDLDLPVMMMSTQEDPITARRALEGGAFRIVQKPITMETLKYLWQDIFRENIRKVKKGKEMDRIHEMKDENGSFNQIKGKGCDEGLASRTNSKMRKDISKKGTRSTKSGSKDEECDSEDANNKIKRKMCTEWTKELHEKFMKAVYELGEGRCYPKEILDVMNVPGLTRMQVASHLQKCRNDNWRLPEERKSCQESTQTSSQGSSQFAQHKRLNSKRFGSMPRSLASSSSNFHLQGSQENNGVPDISLSSKASEEAVEQPHSGSHATHEHFLGNTIHSNLHVQNVGKLVAANQKEHELAIGMELHPHQQQYCQPIMSSDLYNAATNERASRTVYASGQRGPSNDFYHCLQEMGDVYRNFYGVPPGSMVNHNANTLQTISEFDQVFFS